MPEGTPTCAALPGGGATLALLGHTGPPAGWLYRSHPAGSGRPRTWHPGLSHHRRATRSAGEAPPVTANKGSRRDAELWQDGAVEAPEFLWPGPASSAAQSCQPLHDRPAMARHGHSHQWTQTESPARRGGHPQRHHRAGRSHHPAAEARCGVPVQRPSMSRPRFRNPPGHPEPLFVNACNSTHRGRQCISFNEAQARTGMRRSTSRCSATAASTTKAGPR